MDACQWEFQMAVMGPAANAASVRVVAIFVRFGRGVRKRIGVKLESVMYFMEAAARRVRSPEVKGQTGR